MKNTILILTLISLGQNLFAQFTCGDSLVDNRDGQKYGTVLIGNQCWTSQNLNIGTLIQSNAIGQLQSNNGVIEKYCYTDSLNKCSSYGGLYEWDEMMQYNPSDSGTYGTTQGICPRGWHIPTHSEMSAMERALCTTGSCNTEFPMDMTTTGWRGTNEGGKMKDTGTLNWDSPNSGATNSSGFSALPVGVRYGSDGLFKKEGVNFYLWTATESNSSDAWRRTLGKDFSSIFRSTLEKSYGACVRCIMDSATLSVSNNVQRKSNVSVYPNPSNGVVTIAVEIPENNNYSIRISNLNGQVIFDEQIESATSLVKEIDLSKHAEGVYFVEVVTDEMFEVKRVVLQ